MMLVRMGELKVPYAHNPIYPVLFAPYGGEDYLYAIAFAQRCLLVAASSSCVDDSCGGVCLSRDLLYCQVPPVHD